MWFPNTVLLLLAVAQASPSAAKQLTSLDHLSITKRFHYVALKHSAGLARDLRAAWGGVLATRVQQHKPKSKRLLQKRNFYCINQKAGGQVPFNAGNGKSSAHPSPTHSSRPASSTASSTGSGAAPSSTSSWKLVESHVSSTSKIATCLLTLIFRKETTFLMDGLSTPEAIPPMAPSNLLTRELG